MMWKRYYRIQVCVVLATVDQNGIPNAVPINFVKILSDSQIMLVNNAMNKTIANINNNPNVAVTVWFEHDGYQIKGKATHETTGPNFEAGVAMVKQEKPFIDPKGAVIVDINQIYITTPGPDNGKQL